MNNTYIIPANSKKSQLILGFFTMTDLIIFCVGVGISLFLLMIFSTNDIKILALLVSPALLAAFLVAPVPHYHNVMTLIGNVNRFLTGRKKYYWKGWCVKDYGNDRTRQ